jgi:hypothetical protein
VALLMLPPSPEFRRRFLILQAAKERSGGQIDYGTGVSISANVSAPAIIEATIAEQGVATVRCRVTCSLNPDLTDPDGEIRRLRKGDSVTRLGLRWTAAGPMEPETPTSSPDDTPVNWRFDIERVA